MATTNLFSTTPTNEAPKFNLGNMQSASTWNVDPKTQTVAGQLEGILSKDSPLMQQARTRATQGMQSKGLANSSMAIGAADSAMYDAAMPIAAADANTYADAAKTNMGANNQFALQKNDFTQAGSMAEYGANSDNWMADQNANRTSALNTQQQGFDLAKMDKAAAITLNQMTAQQQQDLAKMAVAQGYNLQSMSAQQVNDLAKLSTQQGYTQANMGLQQQQDLAKLAAAQGYNLQNMTVQQMNELEKMQADQQNMLQRLSVDQQNTLRKMALQQDMTLEQLDAQQINDLAKMAFGGDLALKQLDAQTDATKQVAALEADYKSAIQGSASATSLMNNVRNSLDQLNARADLDAATRKTMQNSIINAAQSSLQMIGALAGDVELASYIDNLFIA